PARGAPSSFSIFIASSTTSVCPAATASPALTSSLISRPGIGERTVIGAAAPVDLRDGLLGPAPQDPDAGLRFPDLDVDGLSVDAYPDVVDLDDSFPAVDLDGETAAHDSMNDLSRFERDGWRSLRSAFASICRMRSRVTSKSCPTSS